MSVKRISEFEARDGVENELYDLLNSVSGFIKSSEGNINCEILRSKEDRGKIMVIEEWENEEAHKKSVQSYPPEKMKEAMPLLAGFPKSGYFE